MNFFKLIDNLREQDPYRLKTYKKGDPMYPPPELTPAQAEIQRLFNEAWPATHEERIKANETYY